MSIDQAILFGIIGTIAALCTSLGFVPQIIKGFATKQLKDVSSSTLILSATGTFLWGIYGFYKSDTIIIIANIFTCSTVVLLLVMQYLYNKKI